MTESTNHHNESEGSVFIVYTDEDAAWVKDKLIPRLQAAHIRFNHEGTFNPGEHRLAEFDAAVKNSVCSLLVLSPAFMKNVWSKHTAVLVQTLGLSQEKALAIPIIRGPVDDLPISLSSLVHVNLSEGSEDEWDRLISALRRKMKSRNEMKPAEYVLFVDDNSDVRDVVRTLLEQNGFLFDEAADGEESLNILRKKRIRVIILDLRMKDSKRNYLHKAAGIAFAQDLRDLYPNIPVIIFSAYSDFFESDIENHGVNYAVTKGTVGSQEKLLQFVQQAWSEAKELNGKLEMTSGNYRQDLRKQLELHFDNSELEEIMFDLGGNFASHSNKSILEMMRTIIIFCEENEKIPALIDMVCQKRPSIAWCGE